MAAGAAPLAGFLDHVEAQTSGRLKQSAARWCYAKMSLEDLCKNGARIGLKGIDLVNHDEWPTLQKYGLTPAMTPGASDLSVMGANLMDGSRRQAALEQSLRTSEGALAGIGLQAPAA